MSDTNSGAFDWQNDPFGEDFFLLPHEEEIRARAKQVLQDNRDAIRHHVEFLTWEMMDNPDLLRAFVSLLWHWEAVEPRWIAEASFRSVGDVCRLAESQPLMVFPCLYCGVELGVRNRDRLLRLYRSSDAFCCTSSEHHLSNLLCETCLKQRDDYDDEQRLLDQLRQQALLEEYREKPYAERRATREWAMLKRQVHRRDRYRCRLCGSDDAPLHVHHSTYANYAEERLEDLITLCSTCHERFHFPEAS